MKSITEIAFEKYPNLIVFDVDGVIVPRGTKIIESGSSLTIDLKFPSEKFMLLVKELLNYSNVAISSGRSMLSLKTIFAPLVGEQTNGNVFVLQAENGGRISCGAEEINVGHDPQKLRDLSKIRTKLREIKHKNFKGFEPKESILTVHAHDRIPEIEKILEEYPHYILWNGEAYDIGDPDINKGTGLNKIKQYIQKMQNKNVFAIAIGDRQNDIEMLQQADISVSADPEVLKDCDYGVYDSNQLPGVVLAEKLLERFRNLNLK